VDAVSKVFLDEFRELCRSYKELFGGDDDEQNALAIEQLRTFAIDVFEEFFTTIGTHFDRDDENPQGAQNLLKALDAFHNHMVEIDSHIPEAKLNTAAGDIIANTIGSRTEKAFEKLEQQAVDCLNCFERGTGVGVDVAVGELVRREYESFIVHTSQALRSLSQFLAEDYDFMAQFTSRVVESISCKTSALFLGIGDKAMVVTNMIANQSPDVTAQPLYSILAAKICQDLEEGGVGVVAEKLQLYCANSSEAQIAAKALKADLSPKLLKASRDLLTHYVDIMGQQLGNKISKRLAAADWFQPNDGAADCLTAGDFLATLTAVDERISQLFTGKRKAKQHWRSLHGKVKSYNFNKAIAKDIDRLFAKTPSISSSGLEFSADSILSGIIRLGIKTFTECIRIQTLGTPGLHLVQIDTYVLRITMRGYVGDDSVLDMMLDEAISSAAERCLHPTPLESQVLESLCEPKIFALLGE